VKDSIVDAFFAMNGYGFYIWSAYGVTALVVAVEILVLRARRKAVLAAARLGISDDATGPVGVAE
jgi:heme exporter protein CcmD